tara:strand:- start:1446 stop:2564 length:1119 start_codon:yes stop_codon:yes gene_type:complete
MREKPIVTFVLGTRPEAIKLAPVIITFKTCNYFETRLVLTGQHDEMVKIVMDSFNLKEDNNLRLMTHNQTLSDITCKTLEGLQKEFKLNRPDLVLVQGDTSTAFSAALASFYEKIHFGHIEAGLRTNDLFDPFPEEANRRLISQMASLHFAPTKKAIENLTSSSIKENIFLTGNTVIDALKYISKDVSPPVIPRIQWNKSKILLATIHRRENWGERLENIANGLLTILKNNEDTQILIPMHKNKKVREPLLRILGDQSRAILTEPLEYKELIGSIKNCLFLLTDSGGLQEEATAFAKPVLVLRETTERTEAIDEGISKLVGFEARKIFYEANLLLREPLEYEKMSKLKTPFGDGNASIRILETCLNFLNLNK